MQKSEKISNSVIRRLPRYYRFLGELLREGTEKISSRELAERIRLTASQIRQDLNCFGGFGQQGYGYHVSELRNEIGLILGVDKQHKTVLIGAGNLGRAVALHLNFEKYGCALCGIFDTDPALIGTRIGENEISDVSFLPEFCRKEAPRIAILCTPKSAAPALCETLIGLGVRAFWNFSHYDINLDHSDIIVENVHLGDSLLALCYGVNNENKEGTIMNYTIRQIDSEAVLKSVLEMCWEILGPPNTDLYSEQAWQERLSESCLLPYAEIEGKPVAAALGRAESSESVVLGYCCCKSEYRRRGITSALLAALENSAAKNGYQYITLGSDDSAWGFYEKCGYRPINEIHGQRIYQKILQEKP